MAKTPRRRRVQAGETVRVSNRYIEKPPVPGTWSKVITRLITLERTVADIKRRVLAWEGRTP